MTKGEFVIGRPTAEPRPTSGTGAAPAAASFEVRLASGLALGFGGLIFLAVAGVLALGMWSAHRNTVDLLRDKSQSVLQ